MKELDLALLDVHSGEFRMVKVKNDDELDEYYQYLQCDTIDITSRRVEDVVFDVICDDEGLLKADPVVSAVNSAFQVALVGNLLFAHHNSLGETTSITEDEYKMLQSHLICTVDVEKGVSSYLLWGVD